MSGCSTLKGSKPILPIKKYEKMIVGRFDADYVGTTNCLAACDYKTLIIDLKALPAPAQSLICLKCHTANATFNLHNWNAGIHAVNGVSCFDCHTVHKSPDLKVRPIDTARLCFRCHQTTRVEFSLPSHHPLNEGRVFCTDCHDPHGSVNNNLLVARQPFLCLQCHVGHRINTASGGRGAGRDGQNCSASLLPVENQGFFRIPMGRPGRF